MKLREFLTSLLTAFQRENIDYCFLRNYEELPEANPHSQDLDLLIRPRQLRAATRILRRLKGVSITGFISRSYVKTFFVENVHWRENKRAIQIDFNHGFHWKGMEYLSLKEVLAYSRIPPGQSPLVRAPHPLHEGCISLLTSLIVGGWIKEKYLPQVREIFGEYPWRVREVLRSFYGRRLSNQIVEFTLGKEWKKLEKLVPRLRRQILLRSLEENPLKVGWKALVHYATEIFIRFTPHYIDTVCILGPDGVGKSTLIKKLTSELENNVKKIECRHLKPKIFFQSRHQNRGPVTDPHSQPPRSAFTSLLKLVLWWVEFWLDTFFHGEKTAVLRLYDRYYHDLIVDPRRYRYGGPLALAEMIGKTIPQPGLWILLDAPEEVILARKREVDQEELVRQRRAYRDLIESQGGVIVDASQTPLEVAREVRQKIVEFLAEKRKEDLDFTFGPESR